MEEMQSRIRITRKDFYLSFVFPKNLNSNVYPKQEDLILILQHFMDFCLLYKSFPVFRVQCLVCA